MHLKWLPFGTGLCIKAVDYVLAPADVKGLKRARVEVLRGDPHMVAALADGLKFVHRYKSFVAGWTLEDAPTGTEIDEFLDDFEQVTFAGLEPDQYTFCAVLHGDENGKLDLHVLVPCVELRSLNSLNVAAPGWKKWVDPLRDMHNHKHGFARPDDPARSRSLQPGHTALVTAQALRANLPVRQADAKQQITQWLQAQINAGLVNNRQQVIDALSGIGEVTRASANYISILPDGSAKAMRMKGTIYDQSFDSKAASQIVAGSANAERGSSASRAGRATADSAAAAAARTEFEKTVERRAEYHRARYGKPPRAALRASKELAEAPALVAHVATGGERGAVNFDHLGDAGMDLAQLGSTGPPGGLHAPADSPAGNGILPNPGGAKSVQESPLNLKQSQLEDVTNEGGRRTRRSESGGLRAQPERAFGPWQTESAGADDTGGNRALDHRRMRVGNALRKRLPVLRQTRDGAGQRQGSHSVLQRVAPRFGGLNHTLHQLGVAGFLWLKTLVNHSHDRTRISAVERAFKAIRSTGAAFSRARRGNRNLATAGNQIEQAGGDLARVVDRRLGKIDFFYFNSKDDIKMETKEESRAAVRQVIDRVLAEGLVTVVQFCERLEAAGVQAWANLDGGGLKGFSYHLINGNPAHFFRGSALEKDGVAYHLNALFLRGLVYIPPRDLPGLARFRADVQEAEAQRQAEISQASQKRLKEQAQAVEAEETRRKAKKKAGTAADEFLRRRLREEKEMLALLHALLDLMKLMSMGAQAALCKLINIVLRACGINYQLEMPRYLGGRGRLSGTAPALTLASPGDAREKSLSRAKTILRQVKLAMEKGDLSILPPAVNFSDSDKNIVSWDLRRREKIRAISETLPRTLVGLKEARRVLELEISRRGPGIEADPFNPIKLRKQAIFELELSLRAEQEKAERERVWQKYLAKLPDDVRELEIQLDELNQAGAPPEDISTQLHRVNAARASHKMGECGSEAEREANEASDEANDPERGG